MTNKDTIMLPRKVGEYLMWVLEMVEPYADQLTDYSSTAAEWPLNLLPEKVGVAITALRSYLDAEQPKQEPVAWQERHFFPKVGEWTHWYDCRPRMADYPREQIEQNGVRYQWRPLYAAPPDAPTVKDSLTVQSRLDAESFREERDEARALLNGVLQDIEALRREDKR